MAKRIAVINDDPDILALVGDVLSDEGYDAQCYLEGTSAVGTLRALAPDALVLDIPLESPAAGWQVLEQFKRDAMLSATPVIVCVGDLPQLQAPAQMVQSKGCHLLPKPYDLDDLLDLLHQLTGGPD